MRNPVPQSSSPVLRRSTVAVVVLLGALLLSALPAGAAATAPALPVPDPTIVGGSPAPSGAWPSQVALLQRGVYPNHAALICGGSVVNRSWVLTAAHCVDYGSGGRLPASALDVLVGTQSLSSGGTRIRAVEIRVLPGYDDRSNHRDVALIRLDRPTTAPNQPLVGQGTGITAGTTMTATGWGTTSSGGSRPYSLHQVNVPLKSDAGCHSKLGAEYIASSMICAGFDAGGKDTCQGDSGGPLVYAQGGRWVQAGITSWGYGCAFPNQPGVYTRVAAFSSWIAGGIKYGPHSDAVAYVRRMHLDAYNRQPNNGELFFGVAALNDGQSVGDHAYSIIQSDAYQSRIGGVARLYRAFFLRDADTPGMGYWWAQVNGRRSLPRISNIMASSSEFRDRYGSLSSSQYIDLVYQNVLGRGPDAPGKSFWLSELTSGRRTRGEMMVGFSESSEYRNAHRARINVAISYFGLLRRMPTGGEYTAFMPQPNRTLVTQLVGSYSYANRF